MCTYTQEFYENANNLYASIGMKGHGGIDINCGFGTPIECLLDGYVYSVFDANHKANDGYYAVYIITEYKGQVGELCIGHLNPSVVIGQNVKKGDILGTEANHGIVYQDGTLITIAEQKAGDQRGHHRHWQWRPCVKVLNPTGQCLTSYIGATYRDLQGYAYQIIAPNNGYHGLSPIIGDILSDYTIWKQNLSTPPASVLSDVDIMKEQGIFIKILNSFINILKSLKSSLK